MKKHLYLLALLFALTGCMSAYNYVDMYNSLPMVLLHTQQDHPVEVDLVVEDELNNLMSIIFVSKQIPDLEDARKIYVNLVESFKLRLSMHGTAKLAERKSVIVLVFKNAREPHAINNIICENDRVNFIHKHQDSYDIIHSESWEEAVRIVHEQQDI